MQKAKKILSVILMLTLIASIALTGCATTPVAESSDTPSPDGSSAAAPAPKETVLLNFWTAGTAQDQGDRVEAAINTYLKDTLGTNIQINVEELGWDDSYTQKVNNAVTTGQDVDIVFTCNWVANVYMNSLAGNFLSLDNYLTQYPEIVSILGQDFVDGTKINGASYALPCNKEKFHNWGFLLQKQLVDELGVDITKIKSSKDLEPFYDKVLAQKPGITPICQSNMDVADWKFLDWDNIGDDDVPGALVPNSDGSKLTIVNQFTAPESVAVYKTLKEYAAKGYISPDASSAAGVSDLLKTGQYFAAVSSLKPDKDKEMSASTGIEYVQVDITSPVKTNRETTGAMVAIPKVSKHPDEAMQFINLLYTDATLINLLVYGQEGVDYTSNEDGAIKLIEDSGYASGNGWRWGDQFKNLLLETESIDKWDRFKSANESAPALVSLGFVFNTDALEIQTIIANTKAVTQEYYKTLLCGQAKDVDATVAQMAAKYKDAGADILIAEMQTQFDAWYSANK